jgi:hypothetical protein
LRLGKPGARAEVRRANKTPEKTESAPGRPEGLREAVAEVGVRGLDVREQVARARACAVAGPMWRATR